MDSNPYGKDGGGGGDCLDGEFAAKVSVRQSADVHSMPLPAASVQCVKLPRVAQGERAGEREKERVDGDGDVCAVVGVIGGCGVGRTIICEDGAFISFGEACMAGADPGGGLRREAKTSKCSS